MPRPVRYAFWLLVAWSAVVVLLWISAAALDLGSTDGFNIFFYLFQTHELLGWLVLLLCVVGALALPMRVSPSASESLEWLTGSRGVLVVGTGVGALLWLGTKIIYHSYPFSMDEYCSVFQAQIFLTGKMAAALPELWRPYAVALTPVFVTLDTHAFTWISSYLPVYAGLRALFLAAGFSDALNPVLAAASLILVADCARRIWPGSRNAPIVAVLLLLTSTQFLATSMSYYSMPAHLCANLYWLSLYLRNTRVSLAIAPWVGGLAVGLHQPVVHALFVLPFCLEIVWRRRFALAGYFILVYVGFLALWYWWHTKALFLDTNAHDVGLFKVPGSIAVFTQAINLTLLFTWQSAAFGLGLLVALRFLRELSSTLVCLLCGVGLTFGLYAFYFTNQGHGWGYRYAYGVIGNLVLVAVFGWAKLAELLDRERALGVLMASVGLALCVQIPLRMFEVENTIRPFARARDFLNSIEQDIVVVDHSRIWYGQDLVRNDPRFTQRPVMLHANRLTPAMTRGLARTGSVRFVTTRELVRLDMLADSQLSAAIARGAGAP